MWPRCCQHNTFFNFSHAFTPVARNENNKVQDDLVGDVFAFVNAAIQDQTMGQLGLELTDMTRLVVNKAEDRSSITVCQAYELTLECSEKVIETARKSGLLFFEYPSGPPQGTQAIALGVGQETSLLDGRFVQPKW